VKVNGFQSLNNLTQTESSRSQATTKKADTAAPAAHADVVTHLSSAAQDASQDIDMARVEELRQAIRDGSLSMNADKIAEGLLKSLTDEV